MSLQTRLAALITAIGADIKALQARVPGGAVYAVDVGNASATSFVVTHSLGTQDVVVQARMTASPYELVNMRVEATSTTTVTVYFDTAPALNAVRVVVAAGGSAYTTLIPFVTSLPSSPADGTEIYYVADATNGVIWHLKYRAADPSSYKWQFIGGGDLVNLAAAQVTTTLSTNQDLSGGPSVTVPLAGDYRVVHGYRGGSDTSGSYSTSEVVIAGVATGEVDFARIGTANEENAVLSRLNRTITAAGTVVKIMYRVGGAGTSTFSRRHLTITPVRVG